MSNLKYSFNYRINCKISQRMRDQLGIFSSPSFKPVTTIIENAIAGSLGPPEFILQQLDNSLFSGRGAVFPTIVAELEKTLSNVNNAEVLSIYQELRNKINELHNFIYSIENQASIDELEKVAALDVAKYNIIMQKLNNALEIGAEIDGTINYLSRQLQDLRGKEQTPTFESFSFDPSNISLEMPEEEVSEIKEEKKETEEFDPIVWQSFYDFLEALIDPEEFERMQDILAPRIKERINPVLDQILINPKVRDSTKSRIRSSRELYLDVEKGLNDLRTFLLKGKIKSVERIPDIKSEFEQMLSKIHKVLGKEKIANLEYGTNFEDILLENPMLLGQLVGIRAGIEGKDIKQRRKDKQFVGEEESQGDVFDRIAYERDKRRFEEEEFELSELGQEAFDFLKRHDINSNNDLAELANWFNSEIIGKIYNDILENPEEYGDDIIPKLTQQEQKTVSINQAAVKYSLFQLNANQAFLTALSNRIKSGEDDPKNKQLFTETLSRCFPEELVEKVRESMKNSFPNDYNMLNSKTIAIKDDIWYEKMPKSYQQTLEEIYSLYTSGRKKELSHFAGFGRSILGRMFSLAYGGGYKDIKKKKTLKIEENKKALDSMTYPGFSTRPAILESFSIRDIPFFGKDTQMFSKITSIEKEIRQKIKNIIFKMEDDGILTEDETMKALFYLSYIITSSDHLKRKMVTKQEEKAPDIFSNWMKNYYDLVLEETDPKLSSVHYKYHYPLNYLFKNV